jgi:hypothetical protein
MTLGSEGSPLLGVVTSNQVKEYAACQFFSTYG